uniref:Uncharacterized protein n=1 Tax=Crocodylus porosus TaxID=8502 RepID=A0A7M4E964_CROPO
MDEELIQQAVKLPYRKLTYRVIALVLQRWKLSTCTNLDRDLFFKGGKWCPWHLWHMYQGLTTPTIIGNVGDNRVSTDFYLNSASLTCQ